MNVEEKLLFVAGVGLRTAPSACPIWLEGTTIVYPESADVYEGETSFERARQKAIERSRQVSQPSFVVTRSGNRLSLYRTSELAEGAIIECPCDEAQITRHLIEFDFPVEPVQAEKRLRPSALAGRR